MQSLILIAVAGFGIIATCAWLVVVYSLIRLLGTAKDGQWSKMMFDSSWWRRDRVVDFVEPHGLIHHKRAFSAMVVFMIAVFAVTIVIAFNVYQKGQ